MTVVLADRGLPEIEPGVTIDDLQTIEECDHALDNLMLSTTRIEMQLSMETRFTRQDYGSWRANAEAALRIKRFLIPRVQERRGQIKRQAAAQDRAANAAIVRDRANNRRRIMMTLMHELEPEAMQRIHRIACQRHPDLFSEEDFD